MTQRLFLTLGLLAALVASGCAPKTQPKPAAPPHAAAPTTSPALVPAPAPTTSAVAPQPHKLFADHMVLQRDIKVPVWGTAAPAEQITVSFAGQTKTAAADAQGRWMLRLDPLKVGGPLDMTIKGDKGGEPVVITDILIGEVWLCSGQSNMEFTTRSTTRATEEIAAADYPRIRLFHVRRAAKTEEQTAVDAKWQICSPQTIGNFSAVGYFFGRQLTKQLDVPIGLIESDWGGTNIESWISRASLAGEPSVKYMVGGFDNPNIDPAACKAAVAAWEKKNIPQDPGNKGFGQGWAKQGADTKDWKPMKLPEIWETYGMNIDGIVWFRKDVDVPAAWAGKELSLRLGPIDDFDTAYFNGEQVGAIGRETRDFSNRSRNYTVPAKLVKAGKNTIAVRVFDQGGSGGIYGKPAQMALERSENDALAQPLSLAGDWLYKVELAIEPIQPGPRPMGPPTTDPNYPTTLFNGMIRPLQPFALRGAIWYQGEANGDRGYQYRTLLPLLVNDWRKGFENPNLAFHIVQLANYTPRLPRPAESDWAELREAQSMTAANMKNVGVASTIDIGDARNIHPTNKQDVGLRLGLCAQAITYGQNVEYSGPLYDSMKVEGNKIRLTFKHLGGGLVAKDGKLDGFAIAGEDHKFAWADAKIDGDTVIVSSPDVAKPVVVRYGWATPRPRSTTRPASPPAPSAPTSGRAGSRERRGLPRPGQLALICRTASRRAEAVPAGVPNC